MSRSRGAGGGGGAVVVTAALCPSCGRHGASSPCPLALLATLRRMQADAKLRTPPNSYTGYQAGVKDCIDVAEAFVQAWIAGGVES